MDHVDQHEGARDSDEVAAEAAAAASAALDAIGGPHWRNLTARPSMLDYLRQLWRRRDLAVELARNSLRAEHVDSVLGELWFLLNPLLLVAVYWLVFGVIIEANRGVDNLIGFLAVGVFTFDLTRTGLMRSSRSLPSNRGLMASLHFPRALVPTAVTLEQAYNYLPQIVVTLLILVLTSEPVSWGWLMLVPLLAVQAAFTLGGGLFVARLGHHAQDTSQALPFVLRLLLYLSGVIFSVDRLAESERMVELTSSIGLDIDAVVTAMVLNPFYSFITLARHYLMATQPAQQALWLLWTSVVVWTIVLLVGGLAFFRAAEMEYGRD